MRRTSSAASSRPSWPRSGEERGRPDLRLLEAVETVESVMPVQQPFKLASREVRPEPSEVRVNGIVIGGKAIVVMAGPCSVESEAQVLEVADAVKDAGREDPPRRRLQAAHLALRLPGAQGAGAQVPGRGAQAHRAAGRDRGARDGERRAGGRVRRHPADRRAQHPELHAAAAGGGDGQAGAAQARHGDHHPGVPAVGRVHPGRGQSRT